MENDKGRIYYATGLDNSQLRTDAAQARSILAGVGTSAAKEGDRIDTAMKKIGASIAGVFAVQQVKDFAVQVATVRGQFQQLEAAFKVLTGDAAVAENLMSQLIHTAATTPFGVTDISNAARQLLAYGVEADKVNETLIRLGDICAGLSIPIGDLAYLYGTTMTQGRLYTADLNQFLGRGIPLADELAKQFGVAKEEIRKMVEEGKVGFPEVQQAIINLTNEGGKFGGLMEAQSKTITGQLSNLQDGFEQMFNEIGQSTQGIISESIGLVSTLVEHWRDVGEALMAVISTYGAYKAAVLATAAVQNTVKTVKHTEEAAQLYAVMSAEQKAQISKLNLSKTSEAYYTAVKAEIAAEMERQTQLAVTTQAELNAARERLTAAEAAKVAAAENVAAKRAELEAVIQEAASEQTASAQKRIAIESEAQSRAALRAQRLQEQKDAAIAQARALKEAQASNEVVAAKNREIAAINEKLVAARAEEVQHSRNIVAIRKEMAATVDETTSKKIAKAQTALETAEENLNTASKARNTAAREVNSKAALLDSTVRRANTVETAANTAAQAANATATGVLSVAKTRLTAVAARLNAVIMANPWALALAGVVALGYGIYKLVTYQTDAEKAQKRLNDTAKEAVNSYRSEELQIDALFARLQAAKKGTNEYEAAKKAIIDQYGKYLEGLSSEVRSLEDVAAASNAVKDAAIAAAKARALEKSTKEASDTYVEIESEQRNKLYEFLKERFGNQRTKGGMNLAELYFAQLKPVLEGKQGVKLDEEWAKQFDRTHYIPGDPMTGIGSYTYTTNELKEILNEAAKARKIYNDTMQEAERRFGTAPETKQGDDTPKEVVKNKAYWEKYLKEQQGLLDAMTEAELKTKKAAEIRKNIADAQSHIDSYSVSKQTRSGARTQREVERVEDQTAERTQKIDEYKDAVIAANAEAELEIRQRQIENMDEGYEKQKAQIKLNYDRLIAENKKRGQDMVDALADEKVLEWQNAHPKATKAETIAYRASLNLTVADLAPEQREQIEAYNDLALKAMIKGNRQLTEQQEAAWNEYYAKYGDYMQRRNAIAAKYDAKLLNAGSGSAEEAFLLKQKAEELDALDEEMRGSTTLMGQLFADASERSVAEIQKIIDKAELLMDWLGAQKDAKGAATIDGKTVTRGDILGLGVSENTLQGLERSPEKVESLRNGIARLKGELGSRSPFKRLEEDIKAASAAIKSGDEAEGVAKIGSAVSAFAPALSEFGQSLGTIFDSDELGAKISGVADAVGGLGETAAGVGQIMSGDVVGGAMAAVNGIGKVVGALDGLFGADYSEYEAMKGQYDLLVDVWNDLIAKKKEYIDIDYGAEAQKAGQEALDLLEKEAEATRNLLAARGSSGSGLFTNSIAARTNDDLGGWLAELRKYTHVQDMAVFQTLQNSTADELEKIKEEMPEFWARLDYATQDYLEKLIAIEEQSDEVVESMKEATTGLSFDSFYDGYVDMLADLDADNEDFADSFGEYMRKSILASLMSNVYRDELQKLYNKWAELGEDGYTEDEVSYLQNWAKSVSDRMLAERDKMAETFGWESEDGDTREASAKGIATASQDSVDELNGRATAIQGHTYSISENTKLLLSTANMILQSVLNIESNTDGMSSRMEAVEGDVREVRNTLNDIALKGVRIR